MNASETIRRLIRELPEPQRAHAEHYVANAEESGPYVGRFGETCLYIDAQIYAEYMARMETPKGVIHA